MDRLKQYLLVVLLCKDFEKSTSFLPSLSFVQQLKLRNIIESSNEQTNDDIKLFSTTSTITTDYLKYNDQDGPMKVVAPLKFTGPYPTLSLHFPNLSTASQRDRNVSGVSLDFVVDTGANTNTINSQVASELKLDVIGEAVAGYNTVGTMSGGSTFLLGDCTLDMPEKKEELFMKHLSASALPIASPSGAGLLSSAFLNCFKGGVKFDWHGSSDIGPTLTFYGDDNGMEHDLSGMTRVPIDVIEDVLLPSVTLLINGKEIPALLDTGSPITVLNAAAAKLAKVDTIQFPTEEDDARNNPFKKLMNNVKNANALAQAASKGDLLMIAGAGGKPTYLARSSDDVELSLKCDENVHNVSFSPDRIFVGDLPGLAALGGLSGVSSPPAAVLGMDILKQKPSMLYRINEVYF